MKLSTVVRIGTIAPLTVLSLGIVACRLPDAQPGASGAPGPGPAMATTAPATVSDPLWHYEGDEGPAHWGTLSAKFASCQSGRAQSPIDIVAPARRDTSGAIVPKFAPTSLRIVHHDHVADAVNNGHTIQVNYSEGDTLTVGGSAYQLVQYHCDFTSRTSFSASDTPLQHDRWSCRCTDPPSQSSHSRSRFR